MIAKTTKTVRQNYVQARGGRKTAHAVARVYDQKGVISVNNKTLAEYFPTERNQVAVRAPLEILNVTDKVSATIRVNGGGLNAQAEAVRNALAKALVKMNPAYRLRLRAAGFLTRDARMVERKKYGLKKARRAPQWAKR